MSKEAEYRQIFLTEALENFEKLNNLFVELEQNNDSQKAIDAIFRIVHTLKGNAMLMGIENIAELAHTMEDVFGALSRKELELNKELMDSLFRSNDKLGALINAVESEKKVSYLGIKTKLEIYLKNNQKDTEGATSQDVKTAEAEEESTQTVEEGDEPAQQGSITFADVVQIPVKKMDELLNQVGELVIERDRLIAVYGDDGAAVHEFDGIKRISENLHYSIMNVRMVQMGFLFNKFHRVVRDAASSEQKEVKLNLKGTEVEIDRNILKIISDSLIHLIRNAVSHGIESEGERSENSKPKYGTVTLDANHEKDSVILTVADDGKGIDADKIRTKAVEKNLVAEDVAQKLSNQEIIRYIFEPGFSSADKVTDISGRGVGMDVVKRSVESIGGQVMVETEIGLGTSIHLVLPSSLALKGALIFETQNQEYAIALSYIDSVGHFKKADLHKVSNGWMVDYKEESVLVVFLSELLNKSAEGEFVADQLTYEQITSLSEEDEISMIVADHSGRKIGLVVDSLVRQKEIIEKKLPKPLDGIKMLSGSTILGSGNVCPVIDVAAIMDMLFQRKTQEL